MRTAFTESVLQLHHRKKFEGVDLEDIYVVIALIM